jgi:hypothetical protein
MLEVAFLRSRIDSSTLARRLLGGIASSGIRTRWQTSAPRFSHRAIRSGNAVRPPSPDGAEHVDAWLEISARCSTVGRSNCNPDNFTIQSYLCMMFPPVMLRFILLLGLGAALLVAGACDEQPPDSPLIQAARTGSLDTINLLLDSGADVNLAGPTGDEWDATPLQHAILARQSGAVRLLLDRGADPNRVAGPNAPAPLLLAAGDTDPTFVNLLLAHGADPAVEGESGVTPLSRAVSAGTINGPDRPMFGGCRVETVRALLAHDPALRLKRNSAGNNAIWWARFQRCGDVLRLIGE